MVCGMGFCPAGRAFFLIRQKETKRRLMGCAPKDPPFGDGQGQGKGPGQGQDDADFAP